MTFEELEYRLKKKDKQISLEVTVPWKSARVLLRRKKYKRSLCAFIDNEPSLLLRKVVDIDLVTNGIVTVLYVEHLYKGNTSKRK